MAVRRSEGVRSPRTTLVGALVSLAALLVLSLMLAPRAEAYLYWTNATSASDYSIGRADLDGTGVKQRFIAVNSVGAYARDVTLDSDYVYWAAACFSDAPGACTSGAIGRANLDGTDVDQSLIGEINPGSVAVDAEHVYWTWSNCVAGWGIAGSGCNTDELPTGPGGIARANLDGSGVDQNFISGIDADQLAVDANHIYWTGNLCEPGCQDIASGIGRANLDGTDLEAGFISGLPRSVTGLNALAIDASHIYWTGQVYDFNPGSALGRANLDGSGVEPTFIGGDTGLHSAFWTGVAVDAAHIYWTSYDYFQNFIVRTNLDGSGREGFIAVAGDEHFLPGALAVDALTDPRPEGNARAARTQRQTGGRIVVKVTVKAKEELTAKATGKIKVNPTYKLRPMKVDLASGETKSLKLKPKHRAWKIAKALKQGKNAKAKLTVRLRDAAGNRKTEKLRVRLKG